MISDTKLKLILELYKAESINFEEAKQLLGLSQEVYSGIKSYSDLIKYPDPKINKPRPSVLSPLCQRTDNLDALYGRGTTVTYTTPVTNIS